jgi:hypothetical protein
MAVLTLVTDCSSPGCHHGARKFTNRTGFPVGWQATFVQEAQGAQNGTTAIEAGPLCPPRPKVNLKCSTLIACCNDAVGPTALYS